MISSPTGTTLTGVGTYTGSTVDTFRGAQSWRDKSTCYLIYIQVHTYIHTYIHSYMHMYMYTFNSYINTYIQYYYIHNIITIMYIQYYFIHIIHTYMGGLGHSERLYKERTLAWKCSHLIYKTPFLFPK